MSVCYGYSVGDEIDINGGNWRTSNTGRKFRLTSIYTDSNSNKYAIWSRKDGSTIDVSYGFTVKYDNANSTNYIGTEWNIDSNDQQNEDPRGISFGQSNTGRANNLEIPSNNTSDIWMYATSNTTPTDNDVVLTWDSKLIWLSSHCQSTTVTTSRTTHSGIIPNATNFTIRAPNPGVWYEKTGAGKFKIKFYDQNEPSGGYNITIEWTQLDNTSASHTETVSAAAGDYSIEIDTLTNGVKHNSDITISFNQNSYYSGVFYTANSVLRTFTYLANGPFSGSFTPNTGNPDGSSVTVIIQDDNIDPEGTRTLSYEKPNGTKTNVTLNSANSWSFNTTFVNDTVGTAYIYDTDKDNATSNDIIASATYTWGNGNNGYPRDGYPIVMTNSFNRNRSIYSIGMTHKTGSDPFL